MRTHKIRNKTMGIPDNKLIAKGSATPQEVFLELLRDDIDEFREAQRRIDGMRKSR